MHLHDKVEHGGARFKLHPVRHAGRDMDDIPRVKLLHAAVRERRATDLSGGIIHLGVHDGSAGLERSRSGFDEEDIGEPRVELGAAVDRLSVALNDYRELHC